MKDLFCRLVTQKLANKIGTSIETLLDEIIEIIYLKAKNKPVTSEEIIKIIEDEANKFVSKVLDE